MQVLILNCVKIPSFNSWLNAEFLPWCYNLENILEKVSKSEASRKSFLNEVMAPSAGQIEKSRGSLKGKLKKGFDLVVFKIIRDSFKQANLKYTVYIIIFYQKLAKKN